jgi:Zn-dependent peptidase ImmA (M78 family)
MRHREIEAEANRFAAAFLLPKEAFLSDLIYPNKLDFYVGLKERWKVSISAMIVRAFHLNAINANQYHYLMRQMTRRGWRQREPLDDELKLDQPTVLPKAVDLILSSGTLTASEFLAKLADEADLSPNP